MADLRATLKRDQRVLGLDPGSKTIGLALSDVRLMLASPYPSVSRAKLGKTVEAIRAIATREGVGGLVVGLPLSMDGTRGPAAQAASDWALALAEGAALPCAMWDERLSSAAVNRAMIQEADLTRKKRAAAVDSAAAAYMLQGALDATAASRYGGPPADGGMGVER